MDYADAVVTTVRGWTPEGAQATEHARALIVGNLQGDGLAEIEEAFVWIAAGDAKSSPARLANLVACLAKVASVAAFTAIGPDGDPAIASDYIDSVFAVLRARQEAETTAENISLALGYTYYPEGG
jgi:hypothetical protein